MSEYFDGSLIIAGAGPHTSPLALTTPNESLNFQHETTFRIGLSSRKWHWIARLTIGPNSNDDFALNGTTIADAFNRPVRIGRLAVLAIFAADDNPDTIVIGNAAVNPAQLGFGSTSQTWAIPPGGCFVVSNPTQLGWLVQAGGRLNIQNSSATEPAELDIWILGDDAPALFEAADIAGLADNLRVALDAGYLGSYDGESQTWLDFTANATHFLLGTTSSVEASDPLFGGSGGARAGALTESEFFEFHGGDVLTKASANTAWIDGLHLNGSTFSYICALYPDTASNCALFGTLGNVGTNDGVQLFLSGGLQPQLYTSEAAALDPVGGAADALDQSDWNIVGGSFNESGGNVSFHYANGGYLQVSGSDTFNASFATPQAGAASHVLQIGGAGNSQLLMPNGNRIAFFAMWDAALAKADFDTLYELLRHRFGL